MTATASEKPIQEKWREIDPILQALSDFERKNAGDEISLHHFAIRKTWLASDAYLSRLLIQLLTFTNPVIPGLFRKHALGLLIARLRKTGTYKKLASEAAAIQLKMNGQRLRAFFLPSQTYPEGECLKIIPKRDGISENTRNELAFRKKLTELNCITVPRVERVEEDADFLYIREELIQGQRYRHQRHGSLFITQGLPELCAMYKAAGVQYAPLDRYYDFSLLKQLKKIVSDKEKHHDFLHLVEEAFRINPDIPTSACHNDLLPSNLCVSNEKLYFFDWEMVSNGPILGDLLKLPFKYDLIEKLMEMVAKAVQQNFPAAKKAYHLHFALYVARRIVKQPTKKDRYLRLWNSHHQKFNF